MGYLGQPSILCCFSCGYCFADKNGLHAGSHQGVSVLFSKHFVKEGLIDAEYGKFFARLENMREKSDYTCLFETTEDEVLPMIPQAKALVAIIEGMV